MRKQLFETKLKDGIWLVAILAVVIVTSLSLDDVQGAFRPGKIRVRIYVSSYEVPSDGPVLRPGDAVKLYKKMVGRILAVDFFVAKVKKPPESGVVPGTPMGVRWELVSGLKLEAELFKGQNPQILSLISEDSPVRIESQTLGESAIVLMVSKFGTTVTDGSIINFPRHHASFFDPKVPESRFGEELLDTATIETTRKEIAAQPVSRGTTEPEKKNPSDDF